MARLDCHVDTADGVTLVRLFLTADAQERVRVEPTHDGPVWPPRRQGVPATGWDDDGWEGTVGPERPTPLGYATPAEPDQPPATIAWVEPATGAADDPATARDVLRALGDPAPPRAALEDGDSPQAGGDTVNLEDTGAPEPDQQAGRPAGALAAIDRRLTRAEALAGASSVAEASEAVTEAGGIEAVYDLQDQLAADRRQLQRLEERMETLLDRAGRVEVPAETLARVT